MKDGHRKVAAKRGTGASACIKGQVNLLGGRVQVKSHWRAKERACKVLQLRESSRCKARRPHVCERTCVNERV
eukprot:1379680-Pleurochrysis_carterae.AAC.1